MPPRQIVTALPLIESLLPIDFQIPLYPGTQYVECGNISQATISGNSVPLISIETKTRSTRVFAMGLKAASIAWSIPSLIRVCSQEQVLLFLLRGTAMYRSQVSVEAFQHRALTVRCRRLSGNLLVAEEGLRLPL